MIFLQYFFAVLSDFNPSEAIELTWINNVGDEINWQNDSLQPITWTAS